MVEDRSDMYSVGLRDIWVYIGCRLDKRYDLQSHNTMSSLKLGVRLGIDWG